MLFGLTCGIRWTKNLIENYLYCRKFESLHSTNPILVSCQVQSTKKTSSRMQSIVGYSKRRWQFQSASMFGGTDFSATGSTTSSCYFQTHRLCSDNSSTVAQWHWFLQHRSSVNKKLKRWLNYISVHLLFNTRQMFEMHQWSMNTVAVALMLESRSRVCAVWTPTAGASMVSGGRDWTTAGSDEGLLWPLPHLSPFTLQPVEKEEEPSENL